MPPCSGRRVGRLRRKAVNHDHSIRGEPTSVYANGDHYGTTLFVARHWPKALRDHFEKSPVIELPDGTKVRVLTLQILAWYQWMKDFVKFHQCKWSEEDGAASAFPLIAFPVIAFYSQSVLILQKRGLFLS